MNTFTQRIITKQFCDDICLRKIALNCLNSIFSLAVAAAAEVSAVVYAVVPLAFILSNYKAIHYNCLMVSR